MIRRDDAGRFGIDVEQGRGWSGMTLSNPDQGWSQLETERPGQRPRSRAISTSTKG